MLNKYTYEAIKRFHKMYANSATYTQDQLTVLLRYGELVQRQAKMLLDIKLRVDHLKTQVTINKD